MVADTVRRKLEMEQIASGNRSSKATAANANPTKLFTVDIVPNKANKTMCAELKKEREELNGLIDSIASGGSKHNPGLLRANETIAKWILERTTTELGRIAPHISGRGAKSFLARQGTRDSLRSRGYNTTSHISVMLLREERPWTDAEKEEDRGVPGSGNLLVKYL